MSKTRTRWRGLVRAAKHYYWAKVVESIQSGNHPEEVNGESAEAFYDRAVRNAALYAPPKVSGTTASEDSRPSGDKLPPPPPPIDIAGLGGFGTTGRGE